MKLIDKYILRELAGPFLFGVGVFSVLLAAGFILPRLTELFAESKLGLHDVLLVFIYSIPRYLVLTFAMSALLAVLMAFGRLSAESEMVALHAAGASLPRLAVPGIVFGIAVSLLALVLGELVAPPANHAAEQILTQGPSNVKRDLVFFEKDQFGAERTIYAAALDPASHTMQQVTINELVDSRPVGGIFARRARWNGSSWILADGYSFTLRSGLPPTSIKFREQTIDYLAAPDLLAAQSKVDPAEMSYRELQAHIAALRSEDKDASDFEIELPRRFALPFAALVFTLIGAPLGMRSHRRGSSLGVGLTVLIVFFYYIFWNWLNVVAENGAVAPLLTAWLPNAVFACAGLALIFTARK